MPLDLNGQGFRHPQARTHIRTPGGVHERTSEAPFEGFGAPTTLWSIAAEITLWTGRK